MTDSMHRNSVSAATRNMNSEIETMNHLIATTLSMLSVLTALNSIDAGLLKCRKDRRCEQCATPALTTGTVSAHHSLGCSCCAVPYADCSCHAVASACCGMTAGPGGVAHLGLVHSMIHVAGPAGYSGYEGLPGMDGGGVHGRYPYHSYRRPWAHPGPKSANVSIVW